MSPVPSVAIVPAAGRAERFGSQKLLADVRGEPLLNWTIWSLIDAGVARVVVVTQPDADFTRVPLLSDPRVSLAVNPDAGRGMFSSIQEGLAGVTGDPILVLPADMPYVAASTVALVLEACVRRLRVVVPAHGGRRGHPIAMPGTLRRAILVATPSGTLKDAIGAAYANADELAVDDAGILRDVDTPADL